MTMRYIFVEKLHFLIDFFKINDIMLVRGRSHCIYYGYLHNIKRDVFKTKRTLREAVKHAK